MTGKAFTIVTTTLGAISIKDDVTGEILHNPVGPWKEAHDLHLHASRLSERFSQGTAPLVLFDVGLGAGFNAVAAIHLRQQLSSPRPLRLISFENNMGLFEFCLKNIQNFEELKPFSPMMEQFLSEGFYSEEGLEWSLRQGDFTELIKKETKTPEVIFFDPYSPKSNPQMWSLEVFEDLFHLAHRATNPAVLVTYSISTSIRAGLRMAGFFVGEGPSTGEKHETTLASTAYEDLEKPLGKRWLERWERSSHPAPLGSEAWTKDKIRRAIEAQVSKSLPNPGTAR